MKRAVHLVLVPGPPFVLGVYWNSVHAAIHARTVTGAFPAVAEIVERLPDSVRELLFEDFEGDDTPVVNVAPEPSQRPSETDRSK